MPRSMKEDEISLRVVVEVGPHNWSRPHYGYDGNGKWTLMSESVEFRERRKFFYGPYYSTGPARALRNKYLKPEYKRGFISRVVGDEPEYIVSIEGCIPEWKVVE